METVTLKSIFESNKEILSVKLAPLSLPKDSELIQKTVTNFLGDLFESEGVYRQNLTQSEDYILQAAMSLLNAQQSMIGELSAPRQVEPEENIDERVQPKVTPIDNHNRAIGKEQYPYVIGGTTIGSAAGALLFGTWGGVFGAIAGTALTLYYSSQIPQKSSTNDGLSIVPKTTIKEQKINVEVFNGIVGQICDSVDTLIQTFRAQINRVVDKYESVEKPSLEQEYRFLIEGIQTLVGYKRTHVDDDKYLSKLQIRIEDLAETLENYDLTIEDYSEENKHWFETVTSSNVTSFKMVYPAVLRKGTVVLLGKVFVPENK